MGEQRVSRSRKRELEAPDEFITFSARSLEYITKNKRYVISLVSALVLTFALFSALKHFSDKKEEKAFLLLSKSVNQYESLLKKNDHEKVAMDENFEELVDKYSKNKGGEIAALFYANICYDSGDFDKAIELYKKALQYFKDEPDVYNLALSGLGYSHGEKKDYANAIKYFKMITSGKSLLLKDEAFFNMGIIYSETGDAAKSLEAFQNIVENYPESIYMELAKENCVKKKA